MTLDHLSLPHRNMHLDTLIRLRWLWVIGQTVVVLVAHLGFEFSLPLRACLAVIALSASLNVIVRLRFRNARRLEPKRAGQLLGFDIVALTMLMYLTGGLANPFSFFFIGPVVLSATALPARITAILGTLAILCATLLVFFHYPLLLPLACVFYPVAILPGFLQYVAWALPPTYVFEGLRALLIDQVFRADLMLTAFALNLAYFAVAILAFLRLLAEARRQGSLLQTGE